LLGFTKVNISDNKLGKYYFSILAELNKYGFQCSASSLSGLNWSTASSTRPSTRVCDKEQHLEQLLNWIVAFPCWILGLQISFVSDCNFYHTFRRTFHCFCETLSL